jgi:hypothetical protein
VSAHRRSFSFGFISFPSASQMAPRDRTLFVHFLCGITGNRSQHAISSIPSETFCAFCAPFRRPSWPQAASLSHSRRRRSPNRPPHRLSFCFECPVRSNRLRTLLPCGTDTSRTGCNPSTTTHRIRTPLPNVPPMPPTTHPFHPFSRVGGGRYRRPPLSEPCMPVSRHTAQALQTPLSCG